MNVFYFSSDLFVSVVTVSIASLLENNKEEDEINIYLVDDGIKKENKNKLTEFVQKYNRTIIYIEAPDPCVILKYKFKDRYQMGHSYVRMCIGEILPSNMKRVLCLDSDTLILGSLHELWNLDMQGNILAGVEDCMNLYAYRRQFAMSLDDIYCNAGVYLVDLQLWRQNKIQKKIENRIKEKSGNVFFFEQTLMNYSCRNKILRLPPKYNVYTLFYAFTYKNLLRWRKPHDFYTIEQINEAKKSPLIIHFTRNFYMLSRPWVEGCDHPMTEEYLKYKQITPWKSIKKDNRSMKKKVLYKIWHMIPQNILSVIAGVLYNSVRPRLWWKNE